MRSVHAVRTEGPWCYRQACEHLSQNGLEELVQKYAEAPDALQRFLGEEQPKFACTTGSVFTALSHIIIGQQLAGAATAKIYARYLALFDGEAPTPEAVVAKGMEIQGVGLSRRKAEYILGLGEAMVDGTVQAEKIPSLSDDEIKDMLCEVRGIGPWTVEMFNLATLKRPDVLPAGDLAVRKSVKSLNGVRDLPEKEKLEELTESWRPYRSLGCYFMYKLADEEKGSKTKKGGQTESTFMDPLAKPDAELVKTPTSSKASAKTPPRKRKARVQVVTPEADMVENTPSPKRRRSKRTKNEA